MTRTVYCWVLVYRSCRMYLPIIDDSYCLMLNVSETSTVHSTSLRYHLTELEFTLVLYYLYKPEVLNAEIVFFAHF
jgi:hypothetical protein